ncbi:hypothetical protein GCM10027612_11010 [Microbispora bryophytorum subsp. camponoti]
MTVFADHGAGGGGEPLALLLRPGNAGSNTAADHITATRLALAQLPKQRRRQVLIRTDSGGGTHEFLTWLTRPGRRLSYSIGFPLTEQVQTAIQALPAHAWTPAYDAEGQVRPGAWVAELAGLARWEGWPKGMRLIVRKERPHPGAQLRFTDIDGHRFTCFVASTKRGQLADLELRHRRPARCEDRIRAAKDTGLRNLPLPDFTQNQIWTEIVALACELIAWMQMLALEGPARRYEPKRLRLRLFAVAARLVRGGRRLRLRVAASWPRAANWSLPSPGFRRSRHRPDQNQPAPTTQRGHPRGPGGTPPTRRDDRATRLTTAAISHSSRTDQPATGRARKIEANHSVACLPEAATR